MIQQYLFMTDKIGHAYTIEGKLLSTGFVFTALSVLSMIILWLTNSLLLDDEVFYNSYAEQISLYKIELIKNTKQRYEWVSYIFTPLFLAIKCFFIACVLLVGSIFSNRNYTFNKLFSVAVFSETVFITMSIIKFSWLYFFEENLDLDKIQYFTPLSLLNLFDFRELEQWLLYPLLSFNLFELFYCFTIAYFLSKKVAISYKDSLNFVLSSYIPAFFVWIVFVCFLILNLS